jgi:hypothetical protein
MTKSKKSVSHHPQARPARRGIAERGGWVDQRVAEILESPLSLDEKARLVYELLASKPPIPGDHLAPIEVIRLRLARKFPSLAEQPDGPLTPESMHGTLFMALPGALRAWRPPTRNGGKARGRNGKDGMASFLTFLTNRLVWECSNHIARMRGGVEIPISEIVARGDGEWEDDRIPILVDSQIFETPL